MGDDMGQDGGVKEHKAFVGGIPWSYTSDTLKGGEVMQLWLFPLLHPLCAFHYGGMNNRTTQPF
jgi:hypothetical protein